MCLFAISFLQDAVFPESAGSIRAEQTVDQEYKGLAQQFFIFFRNLKQIESNAHRSINRSLFSTNL